ncbi:GtrA family protein [Oerskovia sp. NPDC057915]|uniref:GtrA family protein n=1 Tax=Oerskovia sp. NPDC057915 TaxID=3346280 RepID=UPI0036D92AC3
MSDERQGDEAAAGLPPSSGSGALIPRIVRHPLAKYLIVGGLSFVVDAGLLWVCTSVLGWAVWLGASIGFWAGVLVNFSLNRIVMNRDKSSLLTQTSRYGVLLAFNYVATLGILHLTTSWGVPIVVAKTAIVAASTCWNYVLYRLWVFA